MRALSHSIKENESIVPSAGEMKATAEDHLIWQHPLL
jgi:hypothetical protein